VITPDANVLLYALDEDQPHHALSKDWLEGVLSGPDTIGFTWNVLLAVVRLSTRPAVFAAPLSVEQVLDVIQAWLDQPNAIVLEPTERHLATLRELLRQAGTAGNLTSDAHLAAIAIENGATLVSFDRDFGRFSGLLWALPKRTL
jgi:uncharacterized protein